MRFGIFGSAQARTRWPRRGQRQRLPGLRRVQRRGRSPRLPQLLRRRASLHRLRPDLRDAESADLDRRADLHAAPGHRRHDAALAQPGAAGRAGRHARICCPTAGSTSASARATGTTSSPASAFPWRRPRRGSRSRWRSCSRRGPPRRRGRITASTGSSTTSSSSRPRRRSRTRRCGWAPAAPPRSGRWPPTATTCCSTSSRRSRRSASASRSSRPRSRRAAGCSIP